MSCAALRVVERSTLPAGTRASADVVGCSNLYRSLEALSPAGLGNLVTRASLAPLSKSLVALSPQCCCTQHTSGDDIIKFELASESSCQWGINLLSFGAADGAGKRDMFDCK